MASAGSPTRRYFELGGHVAAACGYVEVAQYDDLATLRGLIKKLSAVEGRPVSSSRSIGKSWTISRASPARTRLSRRRLRFSERLPCVERAPAAPSPM